MITEAIVMPDLCSDGKTRWAILMGTERNPILEMRGIETKEEAVQIARLWAVRVVVPGAIDG